VVELLITTYKNNRAKRSSKEAYDPYSLKIIENRRQNVISLHQSRSLDMSAKIATNRKSCSLLGCE